jgi:Ca2+/Na+ antiporter
MLELIDKVLSDPTFVWVVVILAVMLTLATFKKLYKLVMIIVAAFIIYVGYLYYTGEEPVEAIDDLIIKGEDVIEDLKDTDLIDIKESAEKVIKDTKKNLQKKIK